MPPLPDLRAQPPPLLLCPPPEPLPPGHPAGHLRGIGAIRLHGRRRRLYNYTTKQVTSDGLHNTPTRHQTPPSQLADTPSRRKPMP